MRIIESLALAFVAAALAVSPISAAAGTTGSLTGTVVSEGVPVANATIVVSSASQVSTTHSDARGHFVFVSLTPDIYTVNVEHEGFSPASIPGLAIFADTSVDLPIHLWVAIVTILRDPGPRPPSLVRPGTSSDLYSYKTPWLSIAPPVGTNFWMLQMTPGITFGAGAPMTH